MIVGYSTRYTITRVDGDAGSFRQAFEAFDRENPDSGVTWFGIQIGYDAKWYEHDVQIEAAMRRSGIARVDLHGEGEQQGDVWDKEYRRGHDDMVAIRKFKYRMVREEQSP